MASVKIGKFPGGHRPTRGPVSASTGVAVSRFAAPEAGGIAPQTLISGCRCPIKKLEWRAGHRIASGAVCVPINGV